MTPAMVGHADGLLSLEGPDLVACLARRAAIEWRLRVVFDRELDHLGGLRPELPSDQGKRHVDAGGHTGRRDDPAVEDETLVDDLGTHGGELSAVSPVRCRAPSLQQAGRGEQPSPVHTDATHCAASATSRSQPAASRITPRKVPEFRHRLPVTARPVVRRWARCRPGDSNEYRVQIDRICTRLRVRRYPNLPDVASSVLDNRPPITVSI